MRHHLLRPPRPLLRCWLEWSAKRFEGFQFLFQKMVGAVRFELTTF